MAIFVVILPAEKSAEAQAAGGADIQFSWGKQFGTAANDGARSVAVGPGGNAYAAGYTQGALEGASFGGSDAFVSKHLSADGGPGWTRQFGSSSSDDAFDVATDQQGNVYVSGSGNPLNRSSSGGFIRKYDPDGNTSNEFTGPTWTKQFNSGRIQTFAADPEGNVYVSLNTGQDVFVYKYGPNGELLASEPFGAFCNLNDFAFGSAARGSSDASVYITGITSGQIDDAGRNCNISPGITTSEDSLFLIKFDGALNKEWHEQFGSEGGAPTAIDVAVDSDDAAYVTGYTNGRILDYSLTGSGAGEPQPSFGNTDSFLFKFDDGTFGNGAMVFAKQFGTRGNDRARGISLADGSAVQIAGNTDGSFEGTTRNPNPGTSDVFVSKRDAAEGEDLVTRQFGGSGNDSVNGVAYDQSSGGLVLAGQTDGALFNEQSAGGSDAYVAKIGPTDLDVVLKAPARLETGRFNDLVGNPFTAEAIVRNTGTSTQTNISVAFGSSPNGLTVEGSSTRTVAALEPGQSRTVSFTVKAQVPREAQEYAMDVNATSGADTAIDDGSIAVPTSGYSYVAIGDSTTTGYSVVYCNRDDNTSGWQFRYGCRNSREGEGGSEPPSSPYPELVADELAAEVDPAYDNLNRVGVWGYTAREALREEADADTRGDEFRRDNGPGVTDFQSQLHGVEDARNLVTVSFGANDMGFSDAFGYWLPAYMQEQVIPGTLETAADVRYLGGIEDPIWGEKYPGFEPYLVDLLDNHLGPARNRGVDVIITKYPNIVSSRSSCSMTHDITEVIVTTMNTGIQNQVNRLNANRPVEDHIQTVSFYDLWKEEGIDHGIGSSTSEDPTAEPWAFGTGCNVGHTVVGQVPDFSPNGFAVENAETFDPHPNQAGAEAMAEAVADKAKEMR